MQRILLPVVALLVLVAGAAIWLGRGPGTEPAATVGAPPSATSPGPDPAVEHLSDDSRRDLSPPAAAPAPEAGATAEPSEAPRPRPGASVTVIFGGEEVFADFYRDIPAEGRKSRLQELEGALAEYTEGDPADPREFQKYQALKDEAEWLRGHPKN